MPTLLVVLAVEDLVWVGVKKKKSQQDKVYMLVFELLQAAGPILVTCLGNRGPMVPHVLVYVG